MRETGYYWIIECNERDGWTIAHYNEISGRFYVEDGWYPECDVFKIHETRILNPDELNLSISQKPQ